MTTTEGLNCLNMLNHPSMCAAYDSECVWLYKKLNGLTHKNLKTSYFDHLLYCSDVFVEHRILFHVVLSRRRSDVGCEGSICCTF